MRQLAHIGYFLASSEIKHRHLSPDKILVSETLDLKLADFSRRAVLTEFELVSTLEDTLYMVLSNS